MEIGNEGTTLTFEAIRQHRETLYPVRLKDAQFSGEATASNFVVGCPAHLFWALADSWRGWTGAMEWRDHEDRLALSATSDGLGHVTLTVTMCRQDPFARLTGTVMLDAGQLEGIATAMEALG